MLGPNNEPLNNELCSLFPPFSKNIEITNLWKVRYLSENLLETRWKELSQSRCPEWVKFNQNYIENTKYKHKNTAKLVKIGQKVAKITLNFRKRS